MSGEEQSLDPGSFSVGAATHLRLWRLSLAPLARLLLLLLTYIHDTPAMCENTHVQTVCVDRREPLPFPRPSQGWALGSTHGFSAVSARACRRMEGTGTGPHHSAVLHNLADQTFEWAQTTALAHNNTFVHKKKTKKNPK